MLAPDVLLHRKKQRGTGWLADLVSSRMSEPRKKRSLARAVRRFRCPHAWRARCHHMLLLLLLRATTGSPSGVE